MTIVFRLNAVNAVLPEAEPVKENQNSSPKVESETQCQPNCFRQKITKLSEQNLLETDEPWNLRLNAVAMLVSVNMSQTNPITQTLNMLRIQFLAQLPQKTTGSIGKGCYSF